MKPTESLNIMSSKVQFLTCYEVCTRILILVAQCFTPKAIMIKQLLHCDVPRHLLTTDDAEILKKVVLHSVATAFASIVCNIKIAIPLLSKYEWK